MAVAKYIPGSILPLFSRDVFLIDAYLPCFDKLLATDRIIIFLL